MFGNHAIVTITGKTWDEAAIATAGGPHSVAGATFTTEYRGGIEGTSICGLLIAYVEGDPAHPDSLVGPYTGFEQVTGVLDGRSGTFVLAASGNHAGGVARTTVEVVEGSGTGELAGLRGAGSYAADAMEYTLSLDYDLG
ncbi:DUF3224 domain-containing protein [Jatrophihabitans sp.]|uniref:DUF3224 domain-containing protein n=1 Tax=Jatrophihabitans sp. TaxID=1932789 RepID=UPI0030C71B13|nr:sle [Jatrophihabitans sp.]